LYAMLVTVSDSESVRGGGSSALALTLNTGWDPEPTLPNRHNVHMMHGRKPNQGP
jgi:hypothetical protein